MSTTTPATPLEEIATTVARLRAGHASGRTRAAHWRKEQLRAVQTMLERHDEELLDALASDLAKPRFEAFATDVGSVTREIAYILRHVDDWMRPQRVRVPLTLRPGRATIMREPLGVALVIAPWNYPIHLVLMPAVAALAAGNAVVLKPSELAPACSRVLARLIPEYLDTEAVAVVEGGVAETTALLEERIDHIFFTGSGAVAKSVMAAAARHLTPVTLELGGKNPVIVDGSADADAAARKITWGKYLNAGQTCVAPDYVLVDRRAEGKLCEALARTIRRYYGADPQQSPDYARIVNTAHFRRVQHFLNDGEIVIGGQSDERDLYIAPTVLRDVPIDAPLMNEEIFGPILPVFAVGDVDEAIDFVNKRPRPLALHVFTQEPSIADRVLTETSSGGACVNSTLLRLSIPTLPFGGVGASGMGAYHGKYGFDTFTHAKAVLRKPLRYDPAFACPPYTRLKQWMLRRFI